MEKIKYTIVVTKLRTSEVIELTPGTIVVSFTRLTGLMVDFEHSWLMICLEPVNEI